MTVLPNIVAAMNRWLLPLALVAATSLALAPPAMGEATTQAHVRVTLLSVTTMSEAQLKGAAGGRVMQWLIEPPEGSPPPECTQVKLFVEGKPYKADITPSSLKKLAPEVVIDDARKLGFGADALGGTVLSPSALIATVLIRGAAIPPETHVETTILLGFHPGGDKSKRRHFFEFRSKGP